MITMVRTTKLQTFYSQRFCQLFLLSYHIIFATILDSNSYPLQVNFTGFSSTKYNLTSPQFSTTGSSPVSCFTFNYYFLIDATRRNELDVVLSDQTRTNNTLIWSMAGVDIDGWRRAEAQIDQRGSYKVKNDLQQLNKIGPSVTLNFSFHRLS